MSVPPDGTALAGFVPPPQESGPDPIEAIDRTVREATEAIEGLHDVFDHLRSLLVLAREERKNELKIGELFVHAQDHVNQAVADAEKRTRQVIAEAELEAAQIVTAAKREAEKLIEETRQSPLPADVTQQLQTTIDGFAQVNSELLSELTSLSQALRDHAAPLPPPPPVAAAADATPPPPPDPRRFWDRDLMRRSNARPPATPGQGSP
jgi:cellobiose-specific phosphotransferase system component IIA